MKHLILLHGALGDSAQFDVLSTLLADDFDVHSFDFSGHGANDYNGEITMIRLSQDISDYIDLNDLDAC